MTIRVRIPQKESNVTVLPEGTYTLEIIEAKETTTKNTGKEMIALILKVCEGAHADKTIRAWFVADEVSGWRLQLLLGAVDPEETIHTQTPTGDKDAEGNDIVELDLPDVDALLGCAFSADCSIDKNKDGQASTRINRMYALPFEEEETTQQETAAAVAPVAPVTPPQTQVQPQRRQALRRNRSRVA
jgi:hypothetical protein